MTGSRSAPRLGTRLLSVVLALASSWWLAGPAQAHEFGDKPYKHVLRTAAKHDGACSALTGNKLAALMLSITWPETIGDSDDYSPSPMTMGRADDDTDLYFGQQQDGPLRRAFWHPGIGMWQLDDSGLGSDMAKSRFNSRGSARRVADILADRYCTSQSLSYVYAYWYACGNGSCATNYQELYDASTDELRHLSTDDKVNRFGGSKRHRCSFPGSTTTFRCLFVNWYRAQGATSSWTGNRDGTPPLAKPYYVFRTNGETHSYEWRVWLSADTGYPTSVGMRRTYGVNSRTELLYSDSVAICDVDRNVCS